MESGAYSRIGRVRKKSAKVLEMEEAEQLEKQLTKGSGAKNKRQTPAKAEILDNKTKVEVVHGQKLSDMNLTGLDTKFDLQQEPEDYQSFSLPPDESDDVKPSVKSVRISSPQPGDVLVKTEGKKRKSSDFSDQMVIIPKKQKKKEKEALPTKISIVQSLNTSELSSSNEVSVNVPSVDEVIETLTPISKPKAASSRKRQAKPSPKATVKEEAPEKKKRAPTAYLLWCNSERSDVVAENPDADFAQISRMLGDKWKALSEKEKMQWKQKAKKLTAKGSTIIQTGKVPAKSSTPQNPTPNTTIQHQTTAKQVVLSPELPIQLKIKENGNTPVDVAAHFKLLGEALSVIGKRLSEHQGQIAVQGSLSVLLDSLLSALGPLVCLTNLLPEMDGCPREVHAATLDNIAYIMPGIG